MNRLAHVFPVLLVGASLASADTFTLTLTDFFNGGSRNSQWFDEGDTPADLNQTKIFAAGTNPSFAAPFGRYTPFTITATFNTNSPGIAGPFPINLAGNLQAYTPSSASLTVDGVTYQILEGFSSYSTIPQYSNLKNYTDVTIFGPTAMAPGAIASLEVGLVEDPVLDGAGIVLDFSHAATAADGTITYSINTGTVFKGGPGTPLATELRPDICDETHYNPCTQRLYEPIALQGPRGELYWLGTYEQEALDIATAVIVDDSKVPEPGTLELMGVMGGLALVAGSIWRRSKG